MARKVFGVAALAALTGILACGDPTGDLRNGAQVVSPSNSLTLINLGGTALITAEILDEQGNPLEGPITATSSNPAAVAVVEVDTFRQGLPEKLKRQFQISAIGLDSVLITFAGGGVSGSSVVKVKPLSLPAVFSSQSVALLDTVTISAPGFLFTPATVVSFGGVDQHVISFAPDSSTVTFQTISTGGGVLSVTGAAPSFLVGTSFTLNSVDTLGVAPAVGTDAIATAPEILLPASGQTVTVSDVGPTAVAADCGNVGNHCRFYKIVIPADGDYTFDFTWGTTDDIGGYFLDAAGNDVFGDFACDANGGGAASQPENCTETFVAGTYYVALADFAGAPVNTTFNIAITAP